jgi:hypothetical protein
VNNYLPVTSSFYFQLDLRTVCVAAKPKQNVRKDALGTVDGGQRGKYALCFLLSTQTHVLLAWLFKVMGLGYALLRGELGYM